MEEQNSRLLRIRNLLKKKFKKNSWSSEVRNVPSEKNKIQKKKKFSENKKKKLIKNEINKIGVRGGSITNEEIIKDLSIDKFIKKQKPKKEKREGVPFENIGNSNVKIYSEENDKKAFENVYSVLKNIFDKKKLGEDYEKIIESIFPGSIELYYEWTAQQMTNKAEYFTEYIYKYSSKTMRCKFTNSDFVLKDCLKHNLFLGETELFKTGYHDFFYKCCNISEEDFENGILKNYTNEYPLLLFFSENYNLPEKEFIKEIRLAFTGSFSGSLSAGEDLERIKYTLDISNKETKVIVKKFLRIK